MIDAKAYEIANTAVLYDADAKLVAAGKSNVLAALTVNDVIEKFVEKDGVISSITAKTLQGKDAAAALTTAKKALADAIVKAEKLVEDNKDVTALASAKTTLGTAITTAEEVNVETASTATIKTATTTLETAIGVFEKAVEDNNKAVALATKVKAVKDAATEGIKADLLAALAEFEGYNADNDDAYWTAVASFNAVDTVKKVEDAIKAVNDSEAEDTLVSDVKKAATEGNKTALLALLADVEGYKAANDDAYFTARSEFNTVGTKTAVETAITKVNTAVTKLDTELAKVVDTELAFGSDVDAAALNTKYSITTADATLSVEAVEGEADVYTVTLTSISVSTLKVEKVVTITVAAE